MNKAEIIAILQSMPVSVNGYLGDALQPTQWNNTIEKLKTLKNSGHNGQVMVPTKFAATQKQLDYLFTNFPNVWLWYAITGLSETNLFSFEDLKNSYNYACSLSNRVVCAIRPIVPNQNDNLQFILPILEMVKNGNRMLLYEGYRDPNIVGSKKYEPKNLFKEISDYCVSNEILADQKCICIVSNVLGKKCPIHHPQKHRNLKLLKIFGYRFIVNDGVLILKGFSGSERVTRGDVAFARIVTGGMVTTNNPIISEILSIRYNKNKRLVCTSSWFSWARQQSCIINCDYCFGSYESKVRVNLDEFGCDPLRLAEDVYQREILRN
jgi:hypothetical protein